MHPTTTGRRRRPSVLQGISAILVALSIGTAGACASRAQGRAATPTASRAATERDTHELLQGTLWMQTSAEFWALASGTYRHAQDTLRFALQDKAWTAALEQTSGYEDLPAAVILDLDETVLDNVPLEAQLVLDRTGSLQPRWGQWTAEGRAPLVAGAREFLSFAASQGVRAFFVTNRSADEQRATLKNLVDQGLPATDETLMVVGENGWTSDKTARRAAVAKTHRILLLVGDDMNDFVSTATLTPEQRVGLAQQHAARWGQRWVLIPNPLYGSWERALYPGVTGDEAILRRKRELLKGIE